MTGRAIDDCWEAFWSSAADGVVTFQRCLDCAAPQHYPRRHCRRCLGPVGWEASGGRGTVYAFTEVHWSPVSEFADQTPYVFALVDLDEGVRLATRLVGDLAGLECGSPVRARIDTAAGERPRILFELVEGSEDPA